MDEHTERERLYDRLSRIGPCDMLKSGVYCPGGSPPDSAAGMCGWCAERQTIREALAILNVAK